MFHSFFPSVHLVCSFKTCIGLMFGPIARSVDKKGSTVLKFEPWASNFGHVSLQRSLVETRIKHLYRVITLPQGRIEILSAITRQKKIPRRYANDYPFLMTIEILWNSNVRRSGTIGRNAHSLVCLGSVDCPAVLIQSAGSHSLSYSYS